MSGMKTITVKTGTRTEILEYLKTTGKKYVHDEKEINDQLDYEIRQGHTYIHLDLTEQLPSPPGCYNQDASEDVIIAEFNKEHQRLIMDDLDNVERRRKTIDCWETIVKMEREAERRDSEYIRAMLELKDQLDRGYKL